MLAPVGAFRPKPTVVLAPPRAHDNRARRASRCDCRASRLTEINALPCGGGRIQIRIMEVAMFAQDAMTMDVLTVGPDATVREIAGLLVRHRISAVPVVAADGEVVGIVSQTDLGHRSETGTEKRRKWWLDAFIDADTKAREYLKSHGRHARDVMTRPIVSVPRDASLSKVAEMLDTHRIRQVPVIEDGKLVGMISRSDLVRKLAEAAIAAPAATAGDDALQDAIWAEINARKWLQAAHINVTVKDGTVELWGAVESAEQRHALRVLVEAVGGVQTVVNNVGILPRVVAA
jgi:CBS domain-containing protein